MFGREEKDQWQAILDAMEDGVMIIDRDFWIIGFNEAAARITGYRKEEAINARCFEVCAGRYCKEDCDVTTLFMTGRPCEEFETTIRTKDGRTRIVRIHTVALRDAAGAITGALRILRDVTEIRELERRLREPERFGRLVGKSRAMQQVYRLIELLRDSTATVLIHGETGTGKELVAEAIHFNSPRAEGPLIKVNCAALPDPLVEDELFGHVRGAFTDAVSDKLGRIELANGGTLFLDEVGDLGPSAQAKLLRVLETGEFERLGDPRTRRVQVRIIAATNKDLRAAVAEHRFREDLFFRLNVVPIFLPPLRDRMEDLPLLAEHFLERLRQATGRDLRLGHDALRVMMRYRWPGNVRELKNALEYAAIVCEGTTIHATDLPPGIRESAPEALVPAEVTSEPVRLRAALEACNWEITRCAELLGIDRSTLWRKMKRYGIRRP
ncbi:Nif-specific regulatory protein [bacterium HR08]|nr:Nif-specific regulatory protein [bacterium HR08]